MTNEKIHKKLFTRRAIILGAFKASLVAGLLGRMFYLQVINNADFSQLSEKNRIKTAVIPPLRGRIFDRNNKALATNEQSYQLIFTKDQSQTQESLQSIASKTSKILIFSEEEKEDLIANLYEMAVDEDLVIADSLNWKQLVELEFHLYDLPGTNIKIGFDRHYPYGILCGHLTGYVGRISNKELAKSARDLYPNLKIGKNGIEKTKEDLLHGVVGVNKIEVNAKGEEVKKISTSQSISGKDITLTIDIDLQQKAGELLKDTAGVVIVSKLDSGEILACLSNPGFDPNLFNHGISKSNWSNLINNPELPLIDRSVAMTYPPGSGFKIIVATAALKNKFDPETRHHCPGYHKLGDRVFHCWNKAGHGPVNLYQAIAGSCNVYFWNVAKTIGIQPIADAAKMMGYGAALMNNDLPREQNGIIPDPNWKEKHIGGKWNMFDTFNSAIGQGYVEATPMQILTMVSRIATGKKIMPSIIKNDLVKDFASLGIERELKIIRKGMEMVVNTDLGTAYSNRILTENIAMAGKTGTCQVISKRHKDDDLSHTSVKKSIKNHGIFVGYAPLNNPQYAYVGIIEHGGTPALAVKIAKGLLSEAQIRKL